VTSLILSPVVNEFGFQGPFLKLGQNIGLLVGAAFWGVASDVWGRKYISAPHHQVEATHLMVLQMGIQPDFVYHRRAGNGSGRITRVHSLVFAGSCMEHWCWR
jgi:hypothetical protein